MEKKKETNLALELKSRLGTIKESWNFQNDEPSLRYHIAEFENSSIHSVRFFSTIGLSEFGLQSMYTNSVV